jgi:hypothetical protein
LEAIADEVHNWIQQQTFQTGKHLKLLWRDLPQLWIPLLSFATMSCSPMRIPVTNANVM